MVVHVTEKNYMQAATSYVDNLYADYIMRIENECTYSLEGLGDVERYRQLLTWFILEKKYPDGSTVLDEFVEKFVDDKALKTKMLGMKRTVHGEFHIRRGPDHYNRIVLMSEHDGKEYEVEVSGKKAEEYVVGRRFHGMIYPWHDDGAYRAGGIVQISKSSEEMMREDGLITSSMLDERLNKLYQKIYESITITPKSKVSTLLKKLPIGWINSVADMLLVPSHLNRKEKINAISHILTTKDILRRIVSGMNEDEKDVLQFVLDKGGSAKYAGLCKRMGGDDTLTSTEEPESPIARLRIHSLLVVGKQRIGGKMYKVAAIPADVMAVLEL